MTTPIRVGVIGAAYGAASHLPTFTALPEYELVAVATSREATARAAAERFGVPTAFAGYEGLCASPKVDLVVVATRPPLHRPMALAALAAGKQVYCEAPLAPTVAEADEIHRAASRPGAGVCAVGMQSRFSPGLWQLRQLVREGWLGKVQNVRATAFYPTFTQPAAIASAGWCADAGNGATSLRVHGLHTADLIRWIFGEFSLVSGVVATRNPYWAGESGPLAASGADSSVISAVVGDGAVCSIHTSWVARFGTGWRLAAHGSDGYLEATAAGHTGHFPVTLRGARQGRPLTEIPPDADAYDVPEVTGDAATYPLARLLRGLAGALRGEPNADIPTVADGLAALRIAEIVEHGESTR